MDVLSNSGKNSIYAIFYGFIALVLTLAPFGYQTITQTINQKAVSYNQVLANGQACENQIMYAIHDKGLDDSIFFKLPLNTGLTQQIGPERDEYDIEAIDTDPQTGVIYGLSGDTDDPATAKKLLVIDKSTGIPDLSTGVQLDISQGQEYKGASFNPNTNELWASGEGDLNLRVINLSDGSSEVRKEISGSPEALAWDLAGDYLYILYQNGNLDRYNNSTGEITTMCNDMGDIEGMEFDLNGNLIIGYNTTSNGFNIDVFDPNTCQVLQSDTYDTDLYDIETMTFDCAEVPYCELELIKEDFVDSVEPGDTLDYRLTLTNTGTGDCTGGGVKLRDYFDAMTDYVSSDVTPTNITSDYVEWNFGTMIPGQTELVNITVDVSDDAVCDSNLLNKSKYWSNETGWGDWVEEDTPIICQPEPACGDGNLDPGEQCDDGNLTNGDGCSDQCLLETTTVSGCKYNDVNNNGVIDSGEEKLSGWTINLDDANSTSTRQTVTGQNGCYEFTDVIFGDYTLEEVNQQGWNQTYPADPGTYNITVNSLDPYEGYDFANYEIPEPVGSIAGCKYKDLDNDGIIDPDEPTVAQWPIILTNSIFGWAQPIATTTTDVDGCYIFNNLESGEYLVGEGTVPGWTQTYPSTPEYHTVNLTAPDQISDIDFANYQEPITEPFCGDGNLDPGEQCDDGNNTNGDGCSDQCLLETTTISGCKYNDVNQNGVIDNGEEKLSGWTINISLIDSDTPVQSAVTDENGCYEFSQVGFSTYSISEEQKSDWTQTYPATGSYTVEVNSLDPYEGYDFANYFTEPPCVGSCGGGGPVNPIIKITKTAAVPFTNPGGIVDYTISVTNTGNTTGRDLVVTDTLPEGLSYYATTTAGVWQLGDILINETKTLTYQVKFADDIAVGNYVNTAVAEVSNGNSDQDDATVEVRSTSVLGYLPLLTISKDVNMTFTNPSGEITYTVKVTNIDDSIVAENVVLTDRLPKEFYFNDNQSDVNSWNLGDMQPQETKTISFLVTVKDNTADGVYDNWAFARADNAPEVADSAPIEVRSVTTAGYELPDTNGSMEQVLSLILGLLFLVAGYLVARIKKEYHLA